jgi:hypothetical protein
MESLCSLRGAGVLILPLLPFVQFDDQGKGLSEVSLYWQDMVTISVAQASGSNEKPNSDME